MATDSFPFDPVQALGVLLIAILLNGYFFGVVSQQLYQYWNSQFKDPLRIKVFVFAQFAIVIVQVVMYWQLAWHVYIVNYSLILDPKSVTWQALASSLCQTVLIMMANTFLAIRIHDLTQSRLQSGLVMGFSGTAFIVGVVNLATTWVNRPSTGPFTPSERATSIVWHVSQAMAECLIMFFLSRVLLGARSGLKASDSVVNRLVRNVVQTGLFATIWSLAALGTYLLLPHNTVYTVFDATSGSIYTHMIYDGLLSRPKLRTRLTERSELEIGLPPQSISHTSQSHFTEGKRTSGARGHGTVSFMSVADFNTATHNTSEASGIGKYVTSESEGDLAGKSAANHDLSM
ncbi:hypothetical protein BC827DRAFT_1232340 [Russula dissimulans]|nr:hypothetical protein BC827DRAFT_1232340 [Russula dissimulans]